MAVIRPMVSARCSAPASRSGSFSTSTSSDWGPAEPCWAVLFPVVLLFVVVAGDVWVGDSKNGDAAAAFCWKVAEDVLVPEDIVDDEAGRGIVVWVGFIGSLGLDSSVVPGSVAVDVPGTGDEVVPPGCDANRAMPGALARPKPWPWPGGVANVMTRGTAAER